ncbi:uncharacterized protein LOC142767045 [Rhipicephalus microplus]|uniref:Evasin n=1 Tax=Rhipicephalus microplus TaxID=6941 RepID=A0A6G5A4N1_RHIMP
MMSRRAVLVIIVSACYLGHGEEQDVKRGHAICQYLHLYTPAGNKQVGCTWHCVGTEERKVTMHSDRLTPECLTVSPAGFDGMKCGVNYKCKLGLCDEHHKCISSNIFIDCWKLAQLPDGFSHVKPYTCRK